MTDRVPVEAVSPFQRLAKVLSGLDPEMQPIGLTVGQSRRPIPDVVHPAIAKIPVGLRGAPADHLARDGTPVPPRPTPRKLVPSKAAR